ncbi:MAG: hypothetical protein GYB68_04150, partial [Chloroflexi bacterium]|nr:hypothetical protein [Chloroflexota bacterium]
MSVWLRAGLILGIVVALSPGFVQAQGETRPALDDAQRFETANFVIHYTVRGVNAVDPTDEDGDGRPDYVAAVAEAAERSWQVLVVEQDWALPPFDDELGGDDRVDIYLLETLSFGFAGYSSFAGGYVGDNPRTEATERHAAHSFIVVDNDFVDPLLAPDESLDAMRVTVAHEFLHVLQAGYDSLDAQFWVYEATATWAESQVYPDLNENISRLPAFLTSPDVCPQASIGRLPETRWYGMWLFPQYLAERFGVSIVEAWWAASR